MAGTNVTATSVLPTWSAEYRSIAELNKVVTDLETSRGAADDAVVAVTELVADHATFKTAVDGIETLIEEMHDDHATNKTLLDELKSDLNLLRNNFLNCSLTAAGLAEGTNAATIKTVNTVNYSIGGQLYTKAATDNIAITATAQQAISTFCLYLVSIDAGGTVTVTKGTELGTDTAVLPALPASSAPIGAFKIATDGATTYTGGTTDNGAAGITDTYYDLMFVNSGADASTAVSASSAATLGTAKPASAPATLTASAPSATAIDTAADMTAAQIESIQFGAVIV